MDCWLIDVCSGESRDSSPVSVWSLCPAATAKNEMFSVNVNRVFCLFSTLTKIRKLILIDLLLLTEL